MSYAQAFQPLLSLLGQRVEAQQQASLLKASQAAADRGKADERNWQLGLLKRKEEAEAPERALKLYAGGMRPFQQGDMRAEDAATTGAMRVGGGVGGLTSLLTQSVAPVVQQQATQTAANDAKVTGGWIKSALSEAEARAQEAERERRANLEFQAQQTRERADADRASREALAREGIAGRKEIAGLAAAMRGEKAAAGKPPTAVQLQAEGFYDRMRQSGEILDAYETGGTITGPDGKPETLKAINPVRSASARAAGVLPLVGESAQNWFTDPDRQRYWNAASNWVRANLRKESGAAIGADEMDKEVSTYFPVAGDSPAVKAQKRQLRKTTESAMARMARTPQEEAMPMAPTSTSARNPYR